MIIAGYKLKHGVKQTVNAEFWYFYLRTYTLQWMVVPLVGLVKQVTRGFEQNYLLNLNVLSKDLNNMILNIIQFSKDLNNMILNHYSIRQLANWSYDHLKNFSVQFFNYNCFVRGWTYPIQYLNPKAQLIQTTIHSNHNESKPWG